MIDSDAGWLVVAEPNKTYNLLALQNGITEELGETNISVGKYTQMRLVLGNTEDNGTNILGNPHPFANYVIFVDGSDTAELDTPSSTIKKNHNFEIIEAGLITMTIDFDANKSITEAGGSGNYILNPVIDVKSKVGVNDSN